MNSKKFLYCMHFFLLNFLFAQERQDNDQYSPSSTKAISLFDPLMRIKHEITTLTDKPCAEKPLSASQKEELIKKYCFELYQLGCASFNPVAQEIKKLWTTIPEQIRIVLVNKSWCVTSHNIKVPCMYYATPHKDWLELISLFIESGLDVNLIINTSGDTLLHRLTDINTINYDQDYDNQAIEQLIERMVKSGANINAQNNVGKTCLHKAYEHQNTALVALLIELGAHRSIKDHWQRIPRSYLSLSY